MSLDRKDPPKKIDPESLIKFLNTNLDFYSMSKEAEAYRLEFKRKDPDEYNSDRQLWQNWVLAYETDNEGAQTFRIWYRVPPSMYKPNEGSYVEAMDVGLYSQLIKDFNIFLDAGPFSILHYAPSPEKLPERLEKITGIHDPHCNCSKAALFLYLQKAMNESTLSDPEKAFMIQAFKNFFKDLLIRRGSGQDRIIMTTEMVQQLDKLAKASVLRKNLESPAIPEIVSIADSQAPCKSPIPKEAHGTLTKVVWYQIQAEAIALAEQATTQSQLAEAVKYFIDRILPLDKKTHGILTAKYELDMNTVNHLLDIYGKEGPEAVIKLLKEKDDEYNIYYRISLFMRFKSADEFKVFINRYGRVINLPSETTLSLSRSVLFPKPAETKLSTPTLGGLFPKLAETKRPSHAPGTLTREHWYKVRDEAMALAYNAITQDELADAVQYLIDRILPLDYKTSGALSNKRELDEKVVNTLMVLHRKKGRDAVIEYLNKNDAEGTYSTISFIMRDSAIVFGRSLKSLDVEETLPSQSSTKPTMGPPGSS